MNRRTINRRPRRSRPETETLEGRRLLAASLASISNLTVPVQQGYALPLDGSGTTDAQIFAITRVSGSPDVAASIVSGPFWTLNVQYTDPSNPANDFSGPLVFQLFNSAGSTTLTPNTVKMITQFTNDGYYTNTGKYITRVATGFPGATDYVVQAGAPNPNGTGNSGQPNTPFANEDVQPLAFTGTDQLGMANAGGTNSNDTHFFITTGSPNSALGYDYTIFGQLIPNPTSNSTPSDRVTLAKLTQIPVMFNSYYHEDSQPVNAPIFTSVSLSGSNPSGVALIDTTQAHQGDTATFMVIATDPADGTSVSREFTVTVGAYGGPPDPTINFQPTAQPVTGTITNGAAMPISLSGQSGYPDPRSPGTLSYALATQPSHGTISDFNSVTGTFVYTPQPGYSGPDSFTYRVTESGPLPGAVTGSDPATVSLTVSGTPPLVTLNRVATTRNRKHQVTGVTLTFSGGLDPTRASNTADYLLIQRGKHGTFVPSRRTLIPIRSASIDTAGDVVTLTPRKPFTMSKPVELEAIGEPPTGLIDALGRPIDGLGNGQPGGNATALLPKRGVLVPQPVLRALPVGAGGPRSRSAARALLETPRRIR
jgi:cyclophilin family peptidyl-prolyl cis-trans isomerase